MRSIVFLDRDGVLNACRVGPRRPPLPPRTLSELRILPGVQQACDLLKRSRYRLVIVTNQFGGPEKQGELSQDISPIRRVPVGERIGEQPEMDILG